MDNKAEKLKKLIDVANDGLNKAEFIKAFKSVLDVVLKIEKNLIKRINEAINSFRADTEALKNTAQDGLMGFKAEYTQLVDKALKEQENGLNFLRDKASSIKNFTNGKDGVNGINGINGINGSPDTPKEIRDKLEFLTGKEKLRINAISGLEEKLKELEEKPLGGKGGGGFSKMHMEMKFIDNELLGTGDGTTVAFTLANIPNPSASLRIVVGAGELFLTDDWTISNKTITFLTAPLDGAKIRVSYRK